VAECALNGPFACVNDLKNVMLVPVEHKRSGQIGSRAADAAADSAGEGGRKKWATLPFYVQRKSSYKQQGVCRTVKLPFTLKSILRQKKNYGHLNISPYKIRIFKKIF
jgi:hypothetical protein